jgi:hypothetical protein
MPCRIGGPLEALRSYFRITSSQQFTEHAAVAEVKQAAVVSGYSEDGSPSTAGSRTIPVCTNVVPGRVTCSTTRNPKCS